MDHKGEKHLMGFSVKIRATAGDGTTINKLGEALEQRMKYMNETARGSVAATAIQVLRSIRTVTKVAKQNKVKVTVV